MAIKAGSGVAEGHRNSANSVREGLWHELLCDCDARLL